MAPTPPRRRYSARPGTRPACGDASRPPRDLGCIAGGARHATGQAMDEVALIIRHAAGQVRTDAIQCQQWLEQVHQAMTRMERMERTQ